MNKFLRVFATLLSFLIFCPGVLGQRSLVDRVFDHRLVGYTRQILVQPDGFIIAIGANSGQTLRVDSKGERVFGDWPLGCCYLGQGVCGALDPKTGNIYVGVSLSSVITAKGQGVIRLLPTGLVDTNFLAIISGSPNPVTVWSIALTGDGQIVIGGRFDLVDGLPRKNIARLSHDGSLDLGFDPERSIEDIYSVVVDRRGRVLAGGSDSASGANLVRYLNTGRVDPDFQQANLSPVNVIALQEDNRILVGGFGYETRNGAIEPLVRLEPDGRVDQRFRARIGSSIVGGKYPSEVEALSVARDGNILVGGKFASVNGVARNSIARFFPNGELDLSFDPRSGPEPHLGTTSITALALDQTGRVLVGGSFSYFDGLPRNGLVRLLASNPPLPPPFSLRQVREDVLILHAETGLEYLIEESSNLRLWSPKKRFIQMAEFFEISLPRAQTEGMNFYRAVLVE